MPSKDDPPDQLRVLRRLRAVAADPVRVDLLELLRLEGPLTYAEIGRRVPSARRGLRAHLRGLLEGEWVRVVEGDGRNAVWAADSGEVRWTDTYADDPNVAQAVEDLWWGTMQRVIERLQTWYVQRERGQWSQSWVEASIQRDYSFWLTPTDLDALDDEMAAVLERARARSDANREQRVGGDLGAVFVTVTGFPLWLGGEHRGDDVSG